MHARLAIVAAAVLFSTGGAAIKLCGLSGWQVACFRSAVAAAVLALAFPQARRGWTWKTALVAVAYAATMILFVLGNKLTTAANTTFLQASAPLYVLALSPHLLGERARRSDVPLMGGMALGLGLFFVELAPASASAPQPLVGNVLAAAAGISWALTLMGLRWLERPAAEMVSSSGRNATNGGGLSAVVLGNLLAAIIAAPWAFPVVGDGGDAAIVSYLGVVQIGLAYVLLTQGFRKVPAFEASLLILLEPVLNPAWAWLLHDERPGLLAMLGGGLILLVTVAKSWSDRASSRTVLREPISTTNDEDARSSHNL